MNDKLIAWLEDRLNRWLTIDLLHRKELENLLASLKSNAQDQIMNEFNQLDAQSEIASLAQVSTEESADWQAEWDE